LQFAISLATLTTPSQLSAAEEETETSETTSIPISNATIQIIIVLKLELEIQLATLAAQQHVPISQVQSHIITLAQQRASKVKQLAQQRVNQIIVEQVQHQTTSPSVLHQNQLSVVVQQRVMLETILISIANLQIQNSTLSLSQQQLHSQIQQASQLLTQFNQQQGILVALEIIIQIQIQIELIISQSPSSSQLTAQEEEETVSPTTSSAILELTILLQIQLQISIQLATIQVPSSALTASEQETEETNSTQNFPSVIHLIVSLRLQIEIQINVLAPAQNQTLAETRAHVLQLASQRIPTITTQAHQTVISLVVTATHSKQSIQTSSPLNQLKIQLALELIIILQIQIQISSLQIAQSQISSPQLIQLNQEALNALNASLTFELEIVFSIQVLVQIQLQLNQLVPKISSSFLIPSLETESSESETNSETSFPIIVKIVFLLELQLKANIHIGSAMTNSSRALATSGNTISTLVSNIEVPSLSLTLQLIFSEINTQAQNVEQNLEFTNLQIPTIQQFYLTQQQILTRLSKSLKSKGVSTATIQSQAEQQVQSALELIIDIEVIICVDINIYHNTKVVGQPTEGGTAEETEQTETETSNPVANSTCNSSGNGTANSMAAFLSKRGW
jgi:hypothetical protein